MNPSLSFSLDERTVAALLQEDESTFNMLGSLLPGAASAALAAAEAQHGDHAAAMQHLLQLQVIPSLLLDLQSCPAMPRSHANILGLHDMERSSDKSMSCRERDVLAPCMHPCMTGQVVWAQAGAGQSADTRREWANAVLEALRTQSRLPGQASLPPPSPEKAGTQKTDTPSSGGVQNPSTSSSGGPHVAQPGGTS